jgi:hypothetical protein
MLCCKPKKNPNVQAKTTHFLKPRNKSLIAQKNSYGAVQKRTTCTDKSKQFFQNIGIKTSMGPE